MKEYIELFLAMAKVGVMTFGGGYAMLPIMQRELVENRQWVSNEELMDWYAMGQCTPGVIAVNTSTFIGKKRKGIPGAIAATCGVVFPSLVIITIIAAVLSNFADLPVVKNAFAGIRVCVCVLILNAVIKLWKGSIKDIWTTLMYLLILAGSLLLELSPVVYVVFAGVLGIVINVVRGVRGSRKGGGQ